MLKGKNPQSMKEVDEWGCAIAWLPMLMIEGAQQTRQAGAAIETFRNEMVMANHNTLQSLVGGLGMKQINGAQ